MRATFRRISRGSALAVAVCLAACGSAKSGDQQSASGAAAGMAGSSAGASGHAGAGGGGGDAGMAGTAGVGPSCSTDTIDCNGSCVGPGMPGGGCTVLAMAGERGAIDHGLALDDAYLYWVEQGGRVAVARVAKTGGTREDLLLPDQIPFFPSVNSTSLFFSVGSEETTLSSMPKGGGAVTVIGTHVERIKNIVATESRVYFSREHFFDSSYEVVSTALDGANEIVHATTASFGENHTAVDATNVYFLDDNFFDPVKLRRTTLEGTSAETVVSIADISTFVLAGDAVVFYEYSGETFRSVPKAGGTATLLFQPSESPGQRPVVAANDRHLYFTTPTGVWRVGLDGSNPVRLLTTGGAVKFIVADASAVYVAVNTKVGGAPAYVIELDQPG